MNMPGIRGWSVASAVLAVLVLLTTVLVAVPDVASAGPPYKDDKNEKCPKGYLLGPVDLDTARFDRNKNGEICYRIDDGIGF